jgi:hypothetical protein
MWSKYFKKVGTVAYCKHCDWKKDIGSKHRTTQLERHLKDAHGDLDKQRIAALKRKADSSKQTTLCFNQKSVDDILETDINPSTSQSEVQNPTEKTKLVDNTPTISKALS